MYEYRASDPKVIARCALWSLQTCAERVDKPLSDIRVTPHSTARYWSLLQADVSRFAAEVLKGNTDEAALADSMGLSVEPHQRNGDLVFLAAQD